MAAALNLIGNYQIECTAGNGGHGEVYKANDTRLGRVVAIKSIRSASDRAIDRESFLREAKALAKLSHPNIVTLYDLIEQDGELFLVMQHIDGVPLSERLKSGPLALSIAVNIMTALADAIAAAHARGILHGDIKPANIMLDCNDRPYLVDFGLAKINRDDDIMQTVLNSAESPNSSLSGTLPYMAPEKLDGVEADDRSDIFSLGAVFFEILSGQRAFPGANEGAVLNSVLHSHPKPIRQFDPEIPRGLSDLIEQMLEKDPRHRIASMERVQAAFKPQGRPNSPTSWLHRMCELWAKLRTRSGLMLTVRLVVVGVALATVAWAAVVSFTATTQPVSTRMAEGVELIHQFGKVGAVERSKTLFSSILTEAPNHAGAEAGMSLALIRDYTSVETDPVILRRATALAESALDRDPQLALANIAAAWAAEFNSDFDRALELFDIADVLDPDNALTFEGRARTYKKQGDFARAEQVLQLAIDAHPDYGVLYDYYGEILGRQGDFAAAEEQFRRGLSIEPDNIQGYANLAQSLHLQGDTKQAIQVVQDGLEIGQNTNLYNNLGTYLFYQGRYEQAAIAFERMLTLEHNSHDFLAWANLADAQMWVPEKRQQAVASYRRAIQLLRPSLDKRPDHQGLNSRLALYSAKVGDHEDAKAALAIVLSDQVQESHLFYRAMVTREVMGQRDDALDMMRRAVEAGYPLNEIKSDPDLSKLREDPNYHLIISELGE